MSLEETNNKILQIRERAFSALEAPNGVEGGYDSRRQAAEDVLFLVQALEEKQLQVEMLLAPHHVKLLMKQFSDLTQVRKALVLELMRELKGEVTQ
jgi:hypothetical protein